jgi:CubicO group peptidase (beta-lactamase class C family)
MSIKRALLLTAIATSLICQFAWRGAQTKIAATSTSVDAALNARIGRVENGLLPSAVIKGAPLATMRLPERMQFYKIPGVSVAVINDRRIEWVRAYGVKDATTKEPITTETLFQAGSISKPTAALAALKLVQEGKLNLDENVNLKLVSWKVPENEFTKTQKVTLRRLLTHSAGLTVHGFPGYAADAELPTLVQVLNGEKPANTDPIRVDTVPGTIWRYSGGGYTIMQQVLVDVEKKPFPEIMREMVLEPVGMKRSTYNQPPTSTQQKDIATAHLRGVPIKGRFHTYPEMAAAGLWTTPSELALLAIELQESLAGRSNKIISQANTAQALSRQFQTWGLGASITVKDQTIEFAHGGEDEGFEAFWVGFSDGHGAAVMTNGDRGAELAMEIIRSISREYGWNDFHPAERELAKVDPKIYESYVGDYQFKISASQTVTVTFSTENGRLLAQQNGGAKREWLPSSETDFFSLTSGNKLTFVKDPAGQVTEVVLNQGGEIYHGKKIK